MSDTFPGLDEIRDTHERLVDLVQRTPVARWPGGVLAERLPTSDVWLKLELFQQTGTFKLRGALANVLALTPDQRVRGVTAVSAGNHAIAVAHAARSRGVTAKVVMLEHSSPVRIARCTELGAEVLLAPDVRQAFSWAQRIEREENRVLIHPFEGERTVLGTAGVGLEFAEQVPGLDVIVVPVGGGGLIAGIAAAIKQMNPGAVVIGVEPEGADAMSRSFASGHTETLDRVETIADSLGAPMTAPYTLGVCRRFVDDIVRVSDDELCAAMFHLFGELKLAVEPAAAAATAAVLGPLRDRCVGRRVGLVVCGTNIDERRYVELLRRGAELVRPGAAVSET